MRQAAATKDARERSLLDNTIISSLFDLLRQAILFGKPLLSEFWVAIPFVTPGLSSTRKQPHYSARASSTNLTRKRRGTSRGALLNSFDYPVH
jgi:hypothetical protein